MEVLRNNSAIPYKTKGHHRWVLFLSFYMDEETLGYFTSEETPNHPIALPIGQNCMSGMIGCIDCEEPYHLAHNFPCDAEPYKGFDDHRN